MSSPKRPDPDQNTTQPQASAAWPVLVVAFAGAVTFVWIGFLLWMAFKVVGWIVGWVLS